MSANQNILAIDNPVDRNGGHVWHQLHSEREDVCEALLKEFRPGIESQSGAQGMSTDEAMRTADWQRLTEKWHRTLLQARLLKIDDALDRLMSGSYGNCSRCGRWIEDTKLALDPAVQFCIHCWQRMEGRH
jgi:RNA polymerase-binding transcription factor DksA